MFNQITSKDIESFINSNALPFELSKKGKRWILTDQSGDESRFDNLKQVQSFLDLQIVSSTGDIQPEAKQGGDAVKIDTSKIVVFASTLNAPVPSSVIDKKATAKLSEDAKTVNHKAIVSQLLIDTNEKTGKPCLPEELKEVDSIKNKFKKLVDKYCLQFSVRGNRVVSVHHRDILEQAKIEANDALKKQADIIAAKLDDWKAESQAQNRYVEGKFPSASYFTDSYNCDGFFSRLDGAFDYESDLVENQLGKVRENVTHAIEAISDYLSGEKKKVRENSISNIAESFGVLKESGIVSGAVVDSLIQKAESVVSSVDLEKIRKAKEQVEKGVVVQVQGKRGRKANPVTEDDLKESQKVLDGALDPLQDLASELEGLV